MAVPQSAAVVHSMGQVSTHRVGGVPGHVRGEHDVVESDQRVIGRQRLDREHIQPRGRQSPAAQGVDQRILVDDLPAGAVDQHGIGFHHRQRVGVEQVRRRLGQR